MRKRNFVVYGPRHRIGGVLWGGIDEFLKTSIRSLFPYVDIYQGTDGKWRVYSVLHSGTTLLQDQMMYEFTLKDPPGQWIIDHLKFHSKERRFGHKDRKQLLIAADNYAHKVEEQKEREWEDSVSEISLGIAKELHKIARGRVLG